MNFIKALCNTSLMQLIITACSLYVLGVIHNWVLVNIFDCFLLWLDVNQLSSIWNIVMLYVHGIVAALELSVIWVIALDFVEEMKGNLKKYRDGSNDTDEEP